MHIIEHALVLTAWAVAAFVTSCVCVISIKESR
jgi:hypothetical protein